MKKYSQKGISKSLSYQDIFLKQYGYTLQEHKKKQIITYADVKEIYKLERN